MELQRTTSNLPTILVGQLLDLHVGKTALASSLILNGATATVNAASDTWSRVKTPSAFAGAHYLRCRPEPARPKRPKDAASRWTFRIILARARKARVSNPREVLELRKILPTMVGGITPITNLPPACVIECCERQILGLPTRNTPQNTFMRSTLSRCSSIGSPLT